MKNKTVTRTYFSKKAGKYVTKTYTYGTAATKAYRTKYKGTPSDRVLTHSGRIIKKNYEALVKGKSITEKADIDAAIYLWQNTKKGQLTATRITAFLSGNRVANMISNSGYSAEDVASYIGTSVTDLLDPNNWHKDTYTDPNTKNIWQFTFDYKYEGNIDTVFTRII